MSNTEEEDFPERGITSPGWMAHALIATAPAEALRIGLRRALATFEADEDDLLDGQDVFDMVIQYTLTGEYIHPEYGPYTGDCECGRDHPVGDEDDPLDLGGMSIDQAVQAFEDLISSWPSAEDPLDSDKKEDDDN